MPIDPLAVASGVGKFLDVVLPYVKGLHPGIVKAFESGDETLTRRRTQEAIERNAFELQRINASKGAPKRARKV